MANLTPIDCNTLSEISTEIEEAKESEDFKWCLYSCIHTANQIQDEELKEAILNICTQDNERFTDKQCIEQLETFILNL